MELVRFPARHVPNPRAAGDAPYGSREAEVIDCASVDAAHAEIRAWPGYRPTPLVALPGLARRLKLATVSYKDEDKRFGLHSFTARRGPHSYERVVGRPWEEIQG